MRSPRRIKFTAERIRQFDLPDRGEVTYWDTEVGGLGVRCLPSGVKSYVVVYRAGKGRAGTPRRMTLGKIETIRLEAARAAALNIRGKVVLGEDPVARLQAQRREKARPVLTLGKAITRYDEAPERQGIVGRPKVLSSLTRHLLGRLGDIPLASLDRRAVVDAIDALNAAGLPGAAKDLRAHASTFLGWCENRGYISKNPMHGYRMHKATRTERIRQKERHGRALSDLDLARIWHGCCDSDVPLAFGQVVRMLILTGQRRTETARMRWADLSDDRLTWRIPAEETKSGNAHEVPLPPLAQRIVAEAVRFPKCEFVFSTRGKTAISGWSKLRGTLDVAIAKALGDGEDPIADWTLHDLRRTFRSGLTRLGVDQEVAEIMLNHRQGTLRSIYDHEPRMPERQEAAERWALHLTGIIDPDGRANVVEMRGAK